MPQNWALLTHILCVKVSNYTQQTRNRAEAWRVIAYVPREKNYYSANELLAKFEPEVKSLHIQQLYEATLSNLKETQRNGLLNNIELKLGNKSKVVNLKIPIMYIIGDIQGGDSICGRHIHYRITSRRIS